MVGGYTDICVSNGVVPRAYGLLALQCQGWAGGSTKPFLTLCPGGESIACDAPKPLSDVPFAPLSLRTISPLPPGSPSFFSPALPGIQPTCPGVPLPLLPTPRGHPGWFCKILGWCTVIFFLVI